MANSKPAGIAFEDPILRGAEIHDSMINGATLNAAVMNIEARNSFSSIGDSLLAFANNPVGGTTSNSHVGWFNDFARRNGGAGIEFTDYQALGGTTLQQLISTQIPACLKADTDGVWLHSGVNNLNSASGNNDPVNTILDQYKQAISILAANKKVVIVDAITPVLQSGSTSSKARAFSFPVVNAGLKDICSYFGNVLFNDLYTAGVDPASSVLNPLSGTVRSDDGIHLLSTGARTYGYASYNNLYKLLNLTPYYKAGPNLLPAFSGTGGTATPGTFITITGTPPVGWEVIGLSGVAATNSVTITSLAPDMIRFTFANTGTSAATTYIRVNNMQALVNPGDKVSGGFGFQLSGLTSFNRLAVNLRKNSTTVWNGMAQDTVNEPTISYPQTAHGGFRTCPYWTVPTGAVTNFEFIIAVNLGSANGDGAGVVDIYTPTMNIAQGINPA